VKPASLWTGESLYGGTGYAALRDGSTATYDLGTHPAALLMPVADLQPGSTGVTTFTAGGSLGAVRSGDVGAQGDSPAPGALLPVTLPKTLGAGRRTVTASTTGGETRLDALMVQPLVTKLVLGGGAHGTALLRSASTSTEQVTVAVPGSGTADVWSYDGQGALVSHKRTAASSVPVSVAPGGFTLVRRWAHRRPPRWLRCPSRWARASKPPQRRHRGFEAAPLALRRTSTSEESSHLNQRGRLAPRPARTARTSTSVQITYVESDST
jgi:hypothetical protein